MRYYFVCYAYRSAGRSNWEFGEALLAGEHPLAARIRWQEHENKAKPGGGSGYVSYRIVSWQELAEAEFNEFDGHIG